MTHYSHSQQSLIFFHWELIPLAIHLCFIAISLGSIHFDRALRIRSFVIFWLIHSEKALVFLHSKRYRLLLYFLLGLQFSLSLPIQTSDWIRIPNETFELSSQALTTCLKQSPYRLLYQFSCSLNGKKITLDLPKNATTIEIQPNKIGLEHTQRYTSD